MTSEDFVLNLSKKIDLVCKESSEIKGDVRELLSEVKNITRATICNEQRIYAIEQNYVTKKELAQIHTTLEEIRKITNETKLETKVNTTHILSVAAVASIVGGGIVSYILSTI